MILAGRIAARAPRPGGVAGLWTSLVSLLAALGLGVGLAAALEHPTDAATLAALLAPLGLLALAGTHAIARHRLALGRLGHRFSIAAAIALGQLLVALIAGGALMFFTGHDERLVVALLLFAAVVAVRCAQILGDGTLRDVEAVRDGLRAVGEGRLDTRVAVRGTDEVAQLARAANAMIAALGRERRTRDDAERARRQLVAAVSHDLRTPLTSLQLLSEAIGDGLVDDADTLRDRAAAMGVHVRRLSALIDDLFELSRLDAGDVHWSMQRVDLDMLVGETVTGLEAHAASRGVRVSTAVAPGLHPARGDPEQLQRVLFNLVQNAIRHTPADGGVTVHAQESDDALEVEVADTGTGIPETERPRVFEPFYRANGDIGGDAGLGLAICRAIVEAHGGQIWLAEAATGTRIRFRLPTAGSQYRYRDSNPSFRRERAAS